MLCYDAPKIKITYKYSHMYMEKHLEKCLNMAYGKIYECLLKN